MTWVIPLPGYTSPPLSLNDRMGWAQARRVRQKFQGDVLLMARSAGLPLRLGFVHVKLHWAPAVVRRRDSDNPQASLKAARDALVRYGVVPDDDLGHMSSDVVIEPVCKAAPSLGYCTGRGVRIHVGARLWLTVEARERP